MTNRMAVFSVLNESRIRLSDAYNELLKSKPDLKATRRLLSRIHYDFYGGHYKEFEGD